MGFYNSAKPTVEVPVIKTGICEKFLPRGSNI